MSTEEYFEPFRQNMIGYNQSFESHYGKQRIVYADWTASGRLYAPIENKISNELGPYLGNTHTETNMTGTLMTQAYQRAHVKIKQHCHANSRDVIINAGFGMTAAINKFQRILGLKIPEQYRGCFKFEVICRPVVFVSHMEHHSNQTSWLETIAEVIVIPPNADGFLDLNILEDHLKKHKQRQFKFGAFTACSNVTGIQTPIHEMAKLMHQYGGYCFVDYAASAPYVDINMHPKDDNAALDAVVFSPHKFLGGPGSSGVLIFNSNLYKNKVPDQPGGGTVAWTNPWQLHRYLNDIEAREDGGTPGFLQAIKAALAIQLKEEMGVDNMLAREKELNAHIFKELESIPHIHILAASEKERLGIFSFYVDNMHYNLMVKLLNDKFGVQVRGGCSCAGTYGHFLLHVDPQRSEEISHLIDEGDMSRKPGWVRMSIHPAMTTKEIDFILHAIRECVINGEKWEQDYRYDPHSNEFIHKNHPQDLRVMIDRWFTSF